MNSYLKEMGKICGLNEEIRIVYFSGNKRIEEVHPKHKLLSTHCGRRTFIVNALYLGIPAEVVMKWTRHSDFTAMKPYIKIVDELKEKEMNKFNLKYSPIMKNGECFWRRWIKFNNVRLNESASISMDFTFD
ncbi:MAG: hypothetical protein LBV41_09865 [Cytophagaceae bacterium]|nr:hypothetical protein [Cytophagaceae bacterium]